MNRLVLSALALLGVLAGAELVRAADPGIPGSYKSELDPSAHRADVAARVKEQIDKLVNDLDPAGQSAAREWLQNEAVVGSNASATSAGYLDLYSDVLNKALEPLLKNPEASPRSRVNAILIAGKVAEWSGTAKLLPTILAALSDKNEAIVMLGENAAGQILPAVFKNLNMNAAQDKKALLDGIVNAVSQHLTTSRAGPIVEAAYAALNPGLKANIAISPDANSSLADAVIKLQESRLALYANGFPDSPDADARGSLFLLGREHWEALSKSQKLASMQNAVNLIWCAAQRASQLPANENQAFIQGISHIGTMLESVAKDNLHSDLLEQAIQPVAKLTIGASPSTILDSCKALYAALQAASPDLKDLKAPPELPPLTKPAK